MLFGSIAEIACASEVDLEASKACLTVEGRHHAINFVVNLS